MFYLRPISIEKSKEGRFLSMILHRANGEIRGNPFARGRETIDHLPIALLSLPRVVLGHSKPPNHGIIAQLHITTHRLQNEAGFL